MVEAGAGAAREARAGWRPRRGRLAPEQCGGGAVAGAGGRRRGGGRREWRGGGRRRGGTAWRARRREAARRHGVEGAAEGGDAAVRRGGRGVGSGAVEAEAYVWGMKSIGARWWLLLTVGPFSIGCSKQPVQKGLLYRLFRTTGAKGSFGPRQNFAREYPFSTGCQ